MAVYREDGMMLRVEVLENNSDEKWKRFKLKIKKVFSNGIYKPQKIGEEFEVEQKKGCYFGGMWHLDLESDHP